MIKLFVDQIDERPPFASSRIPSWWYFQDRHPVPGHQILTHEASHFFSSSEVQLHHGIHAGTNCACGSVQGRNWEHNPSPEDPKGVLRLLRFRCETNGGEFGCTNSSCMQKCTTLWEQKRWSRTVKETSPKEIVKLQTKDIAGSRFLRSLPPTWSVRATWK